MGNTASTSTHRPSSTFNRHTDRLKSPSPTPGNPHSSLRTKKKSLELPDLASLSLTNTRGRQQSTPPKSASIPIPIGPPPPSVIPGEAGRQRPAPSFPSTTDVLLTEPSTHIPFPPRHNSQFRSRQKSQAQAQQRIQELYNQSHVLPPPPPSPTSSAPKFIPETVLSSLPLGIIKALAPSDNAGVVALDDAPVPDLVPVTITWRGGGKTVFLARAGDDDWQGRQPMERESPTSPVFHATVPLLPGTHHIRFLVDDHWRVADDLPTAVDDHGSLSNYVDVPLSYSPPNPSTNVPTPAPPSPPKQQPQTRKLQPGQSFWSAASSTDDEAQDHPADHHHHSHHPHQGPSSPQQRHHHHGHHHHHGMWTSVLPLELIEAAREEETYLNATSEASIQRGGTTYVNGFIPAPNIPPAPGLPRHLDKLILNSRVTPSTPGAGGTGSARGSVSGAGTRKPTPGGVAGGNTGARGSESIGKKQGRERERKEREREREKHERRKERRGVPPAPPPSEVGDVEVVVTAAGTPENETPTPSGDSSIPTSPVISTPTSPSLSPTRGTGPSTAATSAANTPPATATPIPFPPTPVPAHPIPSLSLPSHGRSHSHSHSHSPAASPRTPSSAGPSHSPSAHMNPTTRPLGLGLGLDANEPALADDASVLPVPSHVVLHHLSTSAIRNGVLAVGNTTRYRKKYLTTVYYKPT